MNKINRKKEKKKWTNETLEPRMNVIACKEANLDAKVFFFSTRLFNEMKKKIHYHYISTLASWKQKKQKEQKKQKKKIENPSQLVAKEFN